MDRLWNVCGPFHHEAKVLRLSNLGLQCAFTIHPAHLHLNAAVKYLLEWLSNHAASKWEAMRAASSGNAGPHKMLPNFYAGPVEMSERLVLRSSLMDVRCPEKWMSSKAKCGALSSLWTLYELDL